MHQNNLYSQPKNDIIAINAISNLTNDKK